MANKKDKILIGGILKGATSTNNKTGSWKDKKPVWDKSKCINCMMCSNLCPENCILVKKVKGQVVRGETNLDFCKGCGICEQVCPMKCIKMKK